MFGVRFGSAEHRGEELVCCALIRAKLEWDSDYGLSLLGYQLQPSGDIGTVNTSKVSAGTDGIVLATDNRVELQGNEETGNNPILAFNAAKPLEDPGANNAISFTIPTITIDTNYVLPATDGVAGQVLATNGSGQLSWETASTGGGGGGGVAANNAVLSQPVSETVTSDSNGHAVLTQIGQWGHLIRIQCDQEAWVTLYTSSSARLADSNRLISLTPNSATGVLAEFLLDSNTEILVSPGTSYFNDDTVKQSAIYVAVRLTNGDAVSNASVTVKGYAAQYFSVISGGTFSGV